jgi:hypothetical protein
MAILWKSGQRTNLVMGLDEIDNRRGIQEYRFDLSERFGKRHIRSSLARFTESWASSPPQIPFPDP